MHCGECSGLWIAEQYRNTVGSLYRQQNFRCLTDECVAIFFIAEHAGFGLCFLVASNDTHVGAVGLPAASQGPFAVKELEKPATIFVDIFRVVFVKAGEIERVERHRADAAEPG